MRSNAYLINVSRGGLIDPEALLAALQQGRIAGAGLDVFWEEPVDPGHPIFQECVGYTSCCRRHGCLFQRNCERGCRKYPSIREGTPVRNSPSIAPRRREELSANDAFFTEPDVEIDAIGPPIKIAMAFMISLAFLNSTGSWMARGTKIATSSRYAAGERIRFVRGFHNSSFHAPFSYSLCFINRSVNTVNTILFLKVNRTKQRGIHFSKNI